MKHFLDTLAKHTALHSRELFEDAKNGRRHCGIYRDAEKKSKIRLEKSIASHAAQVEEHAKKMRDPALYDSGWDSKTERQREGLLHKWEKDLKRNAEQAQIELEVWKERFGHDNQRAF